MKAAGLALLVALAGCESGIAIEVRAPDGTEEVALFLATDPCRDCTAVRPPFADYLLEGEIYSRDGASITAPVDETGSAWFRFQPGEIESAFAVVLAVGLLPVADDATYRGVSGSMLLHDLDVTGPRQVVIELETQTNESAEAKVWESAATGDVCAAYVREDPAAATVIVPSENPDCDSTLGVDDCDELTHETNVSSPPLEAATCLTSEAVPDLIEADVCMIGGAHSCSTDPCQPTMYCAPDQACGCTLEDTFDCIATSRTGARIVCLVPVIDHSVGEVYEACNLEDATFPIETESCTSVDLALLSSSGPPTFGEKVEQDDPAGNRLTIKARVPDPNSQGCLVQMSVEGNFEMFNDTIPLPLLARIRVPYLPVAGAVVPVELKPSLIEQVEDCAQIDEPIRCHYEPGGDDLASVCIGLPRL